MDLKFMFFRTNWINLLGIFTAVYIYGIIVALSQVSTFNDLGNSLMWGFLGSFIGIIVFGFYFWLVFITLIFILDLILLNMDRKYLLRKLFLEWIIASSPFIYTGIMNNMWVFYVAVAGFLVAQWYRAKAIGKIIAWYE